MWKKLKNNNKKGFTLVELIVVLVILAILAALLIPALTGYIDKAKEKDVIAKTRQIVMASQTLYDEAYGKTTSSSVTISFADEASTSDTAIVIAVPKGGDKSGADTNLTTVEGLSEVSGITIATAAIDIDTTTRKISKVVYKDTPTGKTCTYENGGYTVTPTAP